MLLQKEDFFTTFFTFIKVSTYISDIYRWDRKLDLVDNFFCPEMHWEQFCTLNFLQFSNISQALVCESKLNQVQDSLSWQFFKHSLSDSTKLTIILKSPSTYSPSTKQILQLFLPEKKGQYISSYVYSFMRFRF